jgi:hypothetical protein
MATPVSRASVGVPRASRRHPFESETRNYRRGVRPHVEKVRPRQVSPLLIHAGDGLNYFIAHVDAAS